MILQNSSTGIVMLTFLALSIFSLLGCFRKKPAQPDHISDWLEMHYGDQFVVLSTPTNFTQKDFYFGKRTSVVAEKADSNVQFILTWVKDQPDLGISQSNVEEAHLQSITNVQRARALQQRLSSAGLKKVSVGFSNGIADFFLFAETNPETRLGLLRSITEVLASSADIISCEVYLMEAAKFGEAFHEIVPVGHWLRLDSWQRSNEILHLTIPANEKNLDPHTLSGRWRFNTMSDRMLIYIQSAYATAQQWAKKHLPKSVMIEGEQGVEFGVDEEDGLLLEIDFPYADTTGQSSVSGMISGYYHVDKGTFTRLHAIPYAVEPEEELH